MSNEDKIEIEKAVRLLGEALTGYSPKSKNNLIREAKQAIEKIK